MQNMDMMNNKKKVIIIGAGPAGLTAAYELLTRSNDYEVIILEATLDIGGISKTIKYNGNRIDIGGHRFFSKSARVMNWWLNVMPIEANTDLEELQLAYQGKQTIVHTNNNAHNTSSNDNVMLVRNRLSRIYYLRKFFSYPVNMSMNTIKNLGLIRIGRIFVSYLKVKLFPVRPEETLEDFFINRFGSELYLTFFKDYTEKVWGFKCNEISKEWGAQRIKGLSIRTTIIHAVKKVFRGYGRKDISQKNIETSLIERFLYPKYGPGQLWEKVALDIENLGGKIFKDLKVMSIDGDSSRIKTITASNSQGHEEVYDGDIYFSTMPIKDFFEAIKFDVNPEVKNCALNLQYRDFITVGILATALEVNDLNADGTKALIKDNWIYIQERDVKIGRLQIFNNWSPYMVEKPENVWLGLEYFCNVGDELWEMEEHELQKYAVNELEKIGILKSINVIDGTVLRVEKTYPAYTGSYQSFHKVQEFFNNIINLYPVGRNGMHKYNNSDHSMLTAMTAVDNILSNRMDKDNIWSINTEEEYHEEK